jgi:hypothetical protein
MEGTQKCHVEKLGNLQPNSLPYWIYRALTNSGNNDMLQGEGNTEATELALQIARWNLQTAKEFIQKGHWDPTQENLENLERLTKKYNLSYV